MKNLIKVIVFILPLILLLTACDKGGKVEIEKSKEAKILKWRFGGKEATISGADIKITYPFGTNITALTAKATLAPKATISPDPAQSRDYKTPVIFTVTAENGTTTKKYTVTVTVAKNDEAKILKWQFGDKEATISGADIKITVPFETDKTALTAKATPSPMATISPDPTQSRDYTNPIKYTVTAENGVTQKQYTVTVMIYGVWEKTYGGSGGDDVAFSLIQTKDGSYAMAGYTGRKKITKKSDFLLVKVDSKGNKKWEKTYGGIENDVAYSLIQTKDGGYALAGWTNSKGAGDADFWLVKVDGNGDKQWEKTYGGKYDDKANSLIQTKDGGYAMVGATESKGADGSYNSDFWLVKVDSNGDKQWEKTYGGSQDDEANSLIQTADGSYVLAGYTYSKGAGVSDFWLVKVADNGNKQWDKTYGGGGFDVAHSLIQTKDGGYALAGYTYSKGAGEDDFWLVKVASNGNKQWDKTYGGSQEDRARSLIQTKDGGYALAGYTYSKDTGDADFWLVKVANNGNKEWDKTYVGIDEDDAKSLIQAKDGGYVLAGYTKGGFELWLIKVNGKGNL